MTIYDIVPVENHGMSVITLIVFFIIISFATVGLGVFMRLIVDKFQEQDKRFDEHDDCVKELRGELSDSRVRFAEVQGTMEKIQMVVDRIDIQMSELGKTNSRIIESLLKKEK